MTFPRREDRQMWARERPLRSAEWHLELLSLSTSAATLTSIQTLSPWLSTFVILSAGISSSTTSTSATSTGSCNHNTKTQKNFKTNCTFQNTPIDRKSIAEVNIDGKKKQTFPQKSTFQFLSVVLYSEICFLSVFCWSCILLMKMARKRSRKEK